MCETESDNVHEAVEQGMVAVDYIPTSENIANGFTKLLTHPVFEIFICELALLSV